MLPVGIYAKCNALSPEGPRHYSQHTSKKDKTNRFGYLVYLVGGRCWITYSPRFLRPSGLWANGVSSLDVCTRANRFESFGRAPFGSVGMPSWGLQRARCHTTSTIDLLSFISLAVNIHHDIFAITINSSSFIRIVGLFVSKILLICINKTMNER